MAAPTKISPHLLATTALPPHPSLPANPASVGRRPTLAEFLSGVFNDCHQLLFQNTFGVQNKAGCLVWVKHTNHQAQMYDMHLPQGHGPTPLVSDGSNAATDERWCGQEITVTNDTAHGTVSYDELKTYLKNDNMWHYARYARGVSRHRKLFEYASSAMPAFSTFSEITASAHSISYHFGRKYFSKIPDRTFNVLVVTATLVTPAAGNKASTPPNVGTAQASGAATASADQISPANAASGAATESQTTTTTTVGNAGEGQEANGQQAPQQPPQETGFIIAKIPLTKDALNLQGLPGRNVFGVYASVDRVRKVPVVAHGGAQDGRIEWRHAATSLACGGPVEAEEVYERDDFPGKLERIKVDMAGCFRYIARKRWRNRYCSLLFGRR